MTKMNKYVTIFILLAIFLLLIYPTYNFDLNTKEKNSKIVSKNTDLQTQVELALQSKTKIAVVKLKTDNYEISVKDDGNIYYTIDPNDTSEVKFILVHFTAGPSEKLFWGCYTNNKNLSPFGCKQPIPKEYVF